jgi:hypothetical protein
MPSKKTQLFIVFLASIISCYIGFINKYPIVYPDTGTYIDTGYRGIVPHDRTIFYGLFIRHISLSASLWLVVFAQGFLICYMLYVSLGIFFIGNKRNYIFIGLIVFLTLYTGFSFNVSILIPDIFSSIAILCLINLLLNPKLNKWQTVFISILFIFSIISHLSNIPILMLLFVLLFLFYLYRKRKKKIFFIVLRKITFSFFLFITALIIIPVVHYGFDNKFQYSRGSHVFIINHLIETGILDDYLKENCSSKNYKICQYKNELGYNFVWREDSPLYKTGGWEANEVEYNAIIKDIFSTPKYLTLISFKSIEYSLKQYFCFNTVVNPPLLINSPPGGQIEWHYKDTQREYLSSLQNNSKLEPYLYNQFQSCIVLCSIVFLFLILFLKELRDTINPVLKWFIILVIMHGVLSCIVCANTATVDARYQNRIVWLLPFLVAIVLLKYFEKKKNSFNGPML